MLVESFSGEKKIGERKIPVEDYYNWECPELEDREYIARNGITESVITNFVIGEETHVFYGGDGSRIKVVTMINGEIEN
ncbi:MAG: hypothetical protein NC253_16120 [Ruminococcus sp.]|nr:hypothetical protein [Ruminococcus sp.]